MFIFDDFTGILRVLVVGVLAYIALIFMLVISGKRTLSKLNSFDLIVTVALGSTLATVLLSNDVALAEGVMAFAVLIGLQYAITWFSARVSFVNSLIKQEPTMLVYQGQMLHDAMRRMRVPETEILQALREQGVASFDQVEAVVLETSGNFSVVKRMQKGQPQSLKDVANYPPDKHEPGQ